MLVLICNTNNAAIVCMGLWYSSGFLQSIKGEKDEHQIEIIIVQLKG